MCAYILPTSAALKPGRPTHSMKGFPTDPRKGKASPPCLLLSSFYSGVAAHCLLQHQSSLRIFNLRGTALSAWTCSQTHPYTCREAGVAEECWCARMAHVLKCVCDHNSIPWQKFGFFLSVMFATNIAGRCWGKIHALLCFKFLIIQYHIF